MSYAAQLAIGRDPMLMVFAAGSTSRLNCSLCEAGTYGTGSGEDTDSRSIIVFEKPIENAYRFLLTLRRHKANHDVPSAET